MGLKPSEILYYLVHPSQARAIIQWSTWHTAVHERDPSKESPSLQRCFHFLQLTSRSFSAVIQELHPELLTPITLFYLILRGLDTIEDDMTIPLDKKDPLLRNFHKTIEKEGWCFDGSGPGEKDRELLVEFHVVTEEFRKIKPAYRTIIADITQKMGAGMADYCANAEHNENGVNTIKDYDLYCHYVAGLVGEGLTRLFVAAELGNPLLLERPHLHESMGLFLQKTNIIRDVREDFEDKRRFWPKEIWSRHVKQFEDLFKPEYRQKALDCQSDMILNALGHAEECLFYLAGLKEQSVFNFAGIPQSMAVATLELCFQNYAMFQRNVKITKGQTCRIMLDSTQNLRKLCEVFRQYSRKMLRKNKPLTHNYKEMSEQCAKLEAFIDGLFPPANAPAEPSPSGRTVQEQAEYEEAKKDTIIMLGLVMAFLFILSTIMIGLAWLFGAQFGFISEDLKKREFLSRFNKPDTPKIKLKDEL